MSSGRLRRVLSSCLNHPRLPLHLAALAFVLTLPSLLVGWQFDDHFHRLVMLGLSQPHQSALQVFSTLKDQETVRTLVDAGILPWWTAPTLRLAFFRYLSAISMWIDYQFWPNVPALMHLHSLLWLAALVAAAALLYRRLIGATWCAGLAALIYALDEGHVMPAAWLANRNALLAAFFGVLCLWTYDRARKDGAGNSAILSPIFLGLALCSGEMALATGGYLFAHALFLDRARWREKAAALTPHVLVLVAWAVVYRIFGFGTSGSDFYQDPLGRPWAFLGAFLSRAPVLMLGQWSPIAADWTLSATAGVYRAFWLTGMAVVAALMLMCAPLIRKDPVARFWALGMLLSLVPVSAVAPANRLLLFAGLGAAGLLALFLHGIVDEADWMPRARVWRRSARALAVVLVIVNLALAPLITPVFAYMLKPLGEPMVAAVASVPDDEAIAQQELVLVNPPDYLFLVSGIPTLKILDGKPHPKRLRVLVAGPSPMQVTRLDERTLRVKATDGIFNGALGRLFRSRLDPIHAGQGFDLPGMRVEILRTDSGGDPVEIAFTFPVPLEDPSLRWMRWDSGRYVPFSPPAAGESVTLPPSYGPFDLLRSRAADEPG